MPKTKEVELKIEGFGHIKVKSKVDPVLVTEHQAMKAYCGSGGIAPRILDGGEWSASRPCSFTPRDRALGIHWIGGLVGPRASLEAVMKRKFLIPCRDSNSQSFSPYLSAIPLS
jgi:hypothetical protein